MEHGKSSQSECGNRRSNSVVNPVEQQQQQQPYAAPGRTRNQDHHMPMTNVTRLMRHILPPQSKIAEDAKEAVQKCTTEFINLVTSEANERCRIEQRKTLSADDIVWAMQRLGFENYVPPLGLYLDRFRESQRDWSDESGEPLGTHGRLPPHTPRLPPALPQDDAVGSSSADPKGGKKLGYYKDYAGAGSSSSASQEKK